jgi:glycosyltransferase involved in cell wall biosynthesis
MAPVGANQCRPIRPNIAFVTAKNPLDLRSWSGIPYFMARALQKHCGEVHWLGPVGRSAVENAERAFNKTSRWLFGKGYDCSHSTLAAKRYARIFKQKLSDWPADLIFAPVAATEIALLDASTPIVYTSDATVASIKDYYGPYSNLFGFSIREAHSIERLAIRKSSLLIYPSAFAAESAIRDYGADESKVQVIPFGANIEEDPAPERVLAPKKLHKCQLLLVGVDWARKGCQIAVETLDSLRSLGIPAQLTICGCSPPATLRTSGLHVIPFLDKKDPAQRKKLAELYLTSHFFLLPTRVDLSPIVLCEANAFGVPVLTTDVGGIADIVSDGENGFMLPISARGPEYAKLISGIWRDPVRYSELCHSSRRAYDERLNWDAWATALGKLLPQVKRFPAQGQLNNPQARTS